MILLLNVLITNKRINTATNVYDRGNLPYYDRLEVFLYSLQSMAKLPWSKALFYCKLDEEYDTEENREKIDKIIAQYNCKKIRFWTRNEYQSDWQYTLTRNVFQEPDDGIFALCNDDHIFVDSNLDEINYVNEYFKSSHIKDGYCSVYPSHWPELLWMAQTRCGSAIDNRAYFILQNNADSVQIVNKNVLNHWWFSADYGNRFLPRTDWFNDHVNPVDMLCMVPQMELFRHFDGYGHVGITNDCPPLTIPHTYFSSANGESEGLATQRDWKGRALAMNAKAKLHNSEITIIK